MVTKEQIINYLESRGIKDKFEKNHKESMARMNGYPEENYSLDKFLDSFGVIVQNRYTDMDRLISGGFPWLLSTEGHLFWENEEKEFQKWLKSLPEDRPAEVSPKVASPIKSITTPSVEELCEIFSTFLENNGCTREQFEENLKNDIFNVKYKSPVTLLGHVENQYKKYGTLKNAIIHAFFYAATPQGVDYWDSIHREWHDFCKAHNI